MELQTVSVNSADAAAVITEKLIARLWQVAGIRSDNLMLVEHPSPRTMTFVFRRICVSLKINLS